MSVNHQQSHVERRLESVPRRLKGASPRRVRAWKARAGARVRASVGLALSPEAANERFMQDHAFSLLAEKQLRAANAAGAAKAATAAAAARTDAQRERIRRDEDRARDRRFRRHVERISIPFDRYIRDRPTQGVRQGPRAPCRVGRPRRRSPRVRRVGAARAGPAKDPAPSEPPDVGADASAVALPSIVATLGRGASLHLAGQDALVLTTISVAVDPRIIGQLAAPRTSRFHSSKTPRAHASRCVSSQTRRSGVAAEAVKSRRAGPCVRSGWRTAWISALPLRLVQHDSRHRKVAELEIAATPKSSHHKGDGR
jgi:hypothetical protein